MMNENSTNSLLPGNPLRCKFGVWACQSDRKFYACKLDKHGNFRDNVGHRCACSGYPNLVCEHYVRQQRPVPIPGLEDLVKND